jgi:acetylornithine deacetylase/succinyl-diaminopimelate desuccinylase-like protein
MEQEPIKAALQAIREDAEQTLAEQLAMCEIPAPSFYEKERARYVKNKFEEIGLEDVHMDEIGNVFGSISGKEPGPTILLAAHLDTVFPMETDVTVRKEGSTYHCPGINDDTRAVAELFTIARAMKRTDLQLPGKLIAKHPVKRSGRPFHLVFCANVCEEGLGDLKGTKYIFQHMSGIDAFISIDDPQTGAIIWQAVGSLRYEVIFTGRGGHSLDDFGLPNPIHAMGRAIQKISDLQVPQEPKTTFNVGVVKGGTSVNTIPAEASMLVDLRSVSAEELLRLNDKVKAAIHQAVEKENARWSSEHKVQVDIVCRGDRPAGTQNRDSAIVKAAFEATKALGIEPQMLGARSTDANIPISLGIPAVTVGRGGKQGGIHTLQEWFDPADAWLGPQRDLLLVAMLAGMDTREKK